MAKTLSPEHIQKMVDARRRKKLEREAAAGGTPLTPTGFTPPTQTLGKSAASTEESLGGVRMSTGGVLTGTRRVPLPAPDNVGDDNPFPARNTPRVTAVASAADAAGIRSWRIETLADIAQIPASHLQVVLGTLNLAIKQAISKNHSIDWFEITEQGRAKMGTTPIEVIEEEVDPLS